MKIQGQLSGDEMVLRLVKRQGDTEPHVDPPGFRGAAVGRLHDPRPAAATNDEAAFGLIETFRPLGQAPGELSRGLVVIGESKLLFCLGQCVAAFRARGLDPSLGGFARQDSG